MNSKMEFFIFGFKLPQLKNPSLKTNITFSKKTS